MYLISIKLLQTKELNRLKVAVVEQKRIVEIIKESLEKCSLIEAQITANEQRAADLLKAMLSEVFER
ncbi:MAG: hypothetical protein ACRC76_05755 [Proteocatella sp.]